jgi:hypothetical protein
MNRFFVTMALALTVCLATSGRTLTAQEETPTVPDQKRIPSALRWPRLVDVQSRSLILNGLTGIPQPAPRASSRDPLKNGAIIGAIAGAAGLGAFGGLICHLYQEDGDASCWSDALRLAAIGAAIGTGAGITVDAALTRHSGVAVRVGVTF